MRTVLAISFGMLLLPSAALWLAGIIAGAVVPLFAGIRAENLGAVGFCVKIGTRTPSVRYELTAPNRLLATPA